MSAVTIKELLEAGVHFGHQTKRWNPKMKKFLFGERNGIYIIDLQKTLKKFEEASEFVRSVAARGASSKGVLPSRSVTTWRSSSRNGMHSRKRHTPLWSSGALLVRRSRQRRFSWSGSSAGGG